VLFRLLSSLNGNWHCSGQKKTDRCAYQNLPLEFFSWSQISEGTTLPIFDIGAATEFPSMLTIALDANLRLNPATDHSTSVYQSTKTAGSTPNS